MGSDPGRGTRRGVFRALVIAKKGNFREKCEKYQKNVPDPIIMKSMRSTCILKLKINKKSKKSKIADIARMHSPLDRHSSFDFHRLYRLCLCILVTVIIHLSF